MREDNGTRDVRKHKTASLSISTTATSRIDGTQHTSSVAPLSSSKLVDLYTDAKWMPKSGFAQMSLIISSLQSLVVMILQVVVLSNILNLSTSDLRSTAASFSVTRDSLVIYHAILLVAMIFSFIMCWDASVHKNTIQMVAFTAFNIFLLGYSIIQLTQHLDAWASIVALDPGAQFIPANVDNRYLQMSVVSVLGLCSLAFIALTWELYREFGWTVFKKLGANLTVRRMYKNHLMLLTLLKLDAFFFISYSAQMSTLAIWRQSSSSHNLNTAWLHVALGIPLSLVALVMGLFALKRESKKLMVAFVVMLGMTGPYLIYQIISVNSAGQVADMDAARHITFFAVTSLVFCMLTALQSVICLRSFGKGLREHLARHKDTNARRNSMVQLSHMQSPVDAAALRWEIED